MPAPAVRIQEKGQVTIPLQIRRKMQLKKGDLVTFVETEKGVVIKPAELIVSEALDRISKALKKKGLNLDELIDSGRKLRGKIIKDEYGVSDHPSK